MRLGPPPRMTIFSLSVGIASHTGAPRNLAGCQTKNIIGRWCTDLQYPTAAEVEEGELSELGLALKRHYESKGEKIKGFQSVDRVSS